MTTKVVLDFSVLAFAMEDSLNPLMTTPAFQALPEVGQKAVLTDIVEGQMQYLASLVFMGENRPSKYQLVFVSDNKRDGQYWRHSYVTLPEIEEARVSRIHTDYDLRVAGHVELKATDDTYKGRKPTKPREVKPICYKGGRKQVSAFQSLLRIVMRESVDKNGWTFLGVKGYEADDVAACVVALMDGIDYVWLLTIDTDWLGLVSDSVGWFNLATYEPRVRASLTTVNQWSQARLGTTFETPRDIWDYKAKVGDASDKLPIFSPIEVIDLLNPPTEHKLWLQPRVRSTYLPLLTGDVDNATLGVTAASYLLKLRALGIRPFIANAA